MFNQHKNPGRTELCPYDGCVNIELSTQESELWRHHSKDVKHSDILTNMPLWQMNVLSVMFMKNLRETSEDLNVHSNSVCRRVLGCHLGEVSG